MTKEQVLLFNLKNSYIRTQRSSTYYMASITAKRSKVQNNDEVILFLVTFNSWA